MVDTTDFGQQHERDALFDALDRDAATAFLEAHKIEPAETNLQQLAVFLYAMKKFVERNANYQDLWRMYGWMDSLHHLRGKMARVMRRFWESEQIPEPVTEGIEEGNTDDAFDVLNYAAFFLRNVQEGNPRGRRL